MAAFQPVELAYQRRRREKAERIFTYAKRWNAREPDEAESHWCPAARVLYADEDGSGAAINRRRDHGSAKIAPCIGERCMAWRWSGYDPVEVEDGIHLPQTGYCGLAGKP